MRAHRQKMRQIGACLECTRPAGEGGLCTYHRELHLRQAARWYRRNVAKRAA